MSKRPFSWRYTGPKCPRDHLAGATLVQYVLKTILLVLFWSKMSLRPFSWRYTGPICPRDHLAGATLVQNVLETI
ncbi:hypothetical protein DPMN_071332 [Dreissena polymorpha]|uniref:Uncharacterized protein n=1 Tax=Dreissena polymorpha TaxID=45954 RepID=A0A9D3Z2E6_DREPO|nr:hypothetical protein DPMN_071332 [Dreissena polymorpha]